MEQAEPVHRMVGRAPHRPRRGSGRRARVGSWSTAGLAPDIVHTSLQTRAIHTAELALRAMGRSWIPVRRDWRLNERHYGDLTGRNKQETTERYGADQVKVWRRSYDVPPPPIDDDNPFNPNGDERYGQVPRDELPRAECLKDVVARLLPCWDELIAADLRAGLTVLVARARQQPSRPGQAPRRHQRRRHRGAQHPHRRTAGVRAGRRPPARRRQAGGGALPPQRRGDQDGG